MELDDFILIGCDRWTPMTSEQGLRHPAGQAIHSLAPKPNVKRLKSPLKSLKCLVRMLFVDTRADRIHTDSLKLDYMKKQSRE